MKYFKAELWRGYNSDNKEEFENSKAQWNKNNKEYAQIFEKVKGRLPKGFLKIYMREHGFHDFHLKNFQIINEREGYRNPVSVSIEVEGGESIWNILYKGVSKVQINYEGKNTRGKVRCFQYGFDDYGYDEFLEVDEMTLSHEILFASDTTILVYFRQISIKRVKAGLQE